MNKYQYFSKSIERIFEDCCCLSMELLDVAPSDVRSYVSVNSSAILAHLDKIKLLWGEIIERYDCSKQAD